MVFLYGPHSLLYTVYDALVEKDVAFPGCPGVARDWWLGSTPGLLLASDEKQRNKNGMEK
jgi:hypothetical protein